MTKYGHGGGEGQRLPKKTEVHEQRQAVIKDDHTHAEFVRMLKGKGAGEFSEHH